MISIEIEYNLCKFASRGILWEVMKKIFLETERLFLRELTREDFDALYEIFSDEETMRYYPKPFDEKRVGEWIDWNVENYRVFGFGLFAVVLKENGKVIGDCGITMQKIHNLIRPEIGYHIHKNYQRRGFALEVARRVRDFAFEETTFNTLYSYMNAKNIASYIVAIKNGMQFLEEYIDSQGIETKVYAITREEWGKMK